MDIFTPDVYTKLNAIIHHLPDHSIPQKEPLAVTAEGQSRLAAEEGAPPALVTPTAGKAIIKATNDANDMDDSPT